MYRCLDVPKFCLAMSSMHILFYLLRLWSQMLKQQAQLQRIYFWHALWLFLQKAASSHSLACSCCSSHASVASYCATQDNLLATQAAAKVAAAAIASVTYTVVKPNRQLLNARNQKGTRLAFSQTQRIHSRNMQVPTHIYTGPHQIVR